MYLEELKRNGLEPSFWMSREWFSVKGWKERRRGDTFWVEEGDLLLFPPISGGKFERREEVWADHVFERSRILDDHFFYRAEDFLELKGRKWKTFRKNIRKWLSRSFFYSSRLERIQIEEFLEEWAGVHLGESFYDLEEMVRYLVERKGKVKGLWVEGRLRGINAWDENYRYVNYRFALCWGKDLGLSEFLRYLFYLDRVGEGKIVNDGGWLGKEGLRRFKMKLNPVRVSSIYTDVGGCAEDEAGGVA